MLLQGAEGLPSAFGPDLDIRQDGAQARPRRSGRDDCDRSHDLGGPTVRRLGRKLVARNRRLEPDQPPVESWCTNTVSSLRVRGARYPPSSPCLEAYRTCGTEVSRGLHWEVACASTTVQIDRISVRGALCPKTDEHASFTIYILQGNSIQYLYEFHPMTRMTRQALTVKRNRRDSPYKKSHVDGAE